MWQEGGGEGDYWTNLYMLNSILAIYTIYHTFVFTALQADNFFINQEEYTLHLKECNNYRNV